MPSERPSVPVPQYSLKITSFFRRAVAAIASYVVPAGSVGPTVNQLDQLATRGYRQLQHGFMKSSFARPDVGVSMWSEGHFPLTAGMRSLAGALTPVLVLVPVRTAGSSIVITELPSPPESPTSRCSPVGVGTEGGTISGSRGRSCGALARERRVDVVGDMSVPPPQLVSVRSVARPRPRGLDGMVLGAVGTAARPHPQPLPSPSPPPPPALPSFGERTAAAKEQSTVSTDKLSTAGNHMPVPVRTSWRAPSPPAGQSVSVPVRGSSANQCHGLAPVTPAYHHFSEGVVPPNQHLANVLLDDSNCLEQRRMQALPPETSFVRLQLNERSQATDVGVKPQVKRVAPAKTTVLASERSTLKCLPRVFYVSKPNELKREFCGFCKKNGELREVFTSHSLHQYLPDGRLVLSCPVLRKLRCDVCGATGDKAHTRTRCPVAAQERPLAILLKSTVRRSDGSVRLKKRLQLLP